eukprot:SAG11_NODE_1907_length_4084_cov_1.378670_2_plen_201_part_00
MWSCKRFLCKLSSVVFVTRHVVGRQARDGGTFMWYYDCVKVSAASEKTLKGFFALSSKSTAAPTTAHGVRKLHASAAAAGQRTAESSLSCRAINGAVVRNTSSKSSAIQGANIFFSPRRRAVGLRAPNTTTTALCAELGSCARFSQSGLLGTDRNLWVSTIGVAIKQAGLFEMKNRRAKRAGPPPPSKSKLKAAGGGSKK